MNSIEILLLIGTVVVIYIAYNNIVSAPNRQRKIPVSESTESSESIDSYRNRYLDTRLLMDQSSRDHGLVERLSRNNDTRGMKIADVYDAATRS